MSKFYLPVILAIAGSAGLMMYVNGIVADHALATNVGSFMVGVWMGYIIFLAIKK